MDELNQVVESETVEVENVVAELKENVATTGKVHISEDVITEVARQALQKVGGIQPASAGIASKLGLGRKITEGIKVSVEEGDNPSISVDSFLMVKYGLRIPDLAWDVQETVKNELEKMTGYSVNYVNVYVQGIYFDEPQPETSPIEIPEKVSSDEDKEGLEKRDESSEEISEDHE